MKKKALITGITGQDGAYLAGLLLDKGYEVHGIKRRSSLFNTERLNHLYEGPINFSKDLFLHYGDMTDGASLSRLVAEIKPDEIYNLAAQSHVSVSFEMPLYTAEVDALGALRLLEAIRSTNTNCRFYQASTSEMFGGVGSLPQSEKTEFYPRSPYAAAKLFAYWITKNYREAYGIFATNGILFNHESPMRGETFVSRKVTRGLARICAGLQKTLFLGNLDARRDWGHAKDYVEAMWRMLQLGTAHDLVIATGVQHTVREFVQAVAGQLGMHLEWSGTGVNEIARDLSSGETVVAVDPRYFRPTEVDFLLGDSSMARALLKWSPKISFEELVIEMTSHDVDLARQEKLLKSSKP